MLWQPRHGYDESVIAEGAPERGTPARASDIPDKLYFRIGEVSQLAGVKPYVLRFWETEFPMIAPRKSGTGHRLYRRKDVETVLLIRELLYERRFTIPGARQFLEQRPKGKSPAPVAPDPLLPVPAEPVEGAVAAQPSLSDIRRELQDLLNSLS